jgi:hypothetical protein
LTRTSPQTSGLCLRINYEHCYVKSSQLMEEDYSIAYTTGTVLYIACTMGTVPDIAYAEGLIHEITYTVESYNRGPILTCQWLVSLVTRCLSMVRRRATRLRCGGCLTARTTFGVTSWGHGGRRGTRTTISMRTMGADYSLAAVVRLSRRTAQIVPYNLLPAVKTGYEKTTSPSLGSTDCSCRPSKASEKGCRTPTSRTCCLGREGR